MKSYQNYRFYCYQGAVGPQIAGQQKEYLQVYYLVLQVCYYLMVGQVKSVKPVLKQLQQSIQVSKMIKK